MTALRWMTLIGLRSPDLAPLRDLPSLTELTVDTLTGDVDYSPLGGPPRLEFLHVLVREPAGAGSLATVDFGGLDALESLALHSAAKPPVSLSLAWLPRLPNLTRFAMRGFALDDAALAELAAARPLREISISVRTWQDLDRLEALRPDAFVRGELLDADERTYGVIFEHPSEFSVGFDLVEAWGAETNPEGESELRDMVEKRDLALAGRLRYDTEGSGVWVLADRRGDLDAVRMLVDEHRSTDPGNAGQ
jgi:hypothetical protein